MVGTNTPKTTTNNPNNTLKGGTGNAGPGVPSNSPLLNPGQALGGQSLYNAALALTNAQDQGPLTELAKQIAANQANARAQVKLVGGYYNHLGQLVGQGVGQEGQIAGQTNQALQGIAADENNQLGQYGTNAQAALQHYSPGGFNSLGANSLAQQLARTSGLAAQDEGAFRSFGAQQGGNFGQLAAVGNISTALQGQQALKSISQAGQLKNEPLTQKIADLQSSKGALLSTNLGKLRQQEINNAIAEQGIGVKQSTLKAQIANDNARNKLTAQGINAANQRSQNSINAQNTRAANANSNRLSIAQSNNATRQAINAANIAAKGKTGGTKPLATSLNNRALGYLGTLITTARGYQQQGIYATRNGVTYNGKTYQKGAQILAPNQVTPDVLKQVLGSAGTAGSYADGILTEAALELISSGSISGATARAMHNAGIRGGDYNGAPIAVGPGGSGTRQPVLNAPGHHQGL